MTDMRPYPLPALSVCWLLLTALVPCLPAADAGRVLMGADATAQVAIGSQAFAALTVGAATAGWHFASARADGEPGANLDGQRVRFRIDLADGGAITGAVEASRDDTGRISLQYRFTSARAVALDSLHVAISLPVAAWIGGTWGAGARSGVFPTAAGGLILANGPVDNAFLGDPAGRRLDLAFPRPTAVLVQDGRRWGPEFTVRIGFQSLRLEPENPRTLDLVLATAGGLALAIDHPVTIAAGPEWIPLTDDRDIEAGSALDLSALSAVPAGADRLVATPEGHFALAGRPDQPLRFWGVNLCFSACFPTPDESERLATRLHRLGYNAVRLHHYDGALVGQQRAGFTLNSAAMDSLDHLAAACIRAGLWLTTDLYVSRPVSRAQVGLPGNGNAELKAEAYLSDAAVADWQRFTELLLTHVNPYTGRRWADEPALAWLCMINEGNMANHWNAVAARPEWRQRWNAWLAGRYPDRAAVAAAWGAELHADEDPAQGTVALPASLMAPTPRARDAQLFVGATEGALFDRLAAIVRATGCRALLTNGNGWANPAGIQAGRAHFDYVDDHFYVDHPQFLAQPWRLPSRCDNHDPLRDGMPGGSGSAFLRLVGKPFTITEFNYAAPGRYRALGGPLTGALAGLQGWDGIWRFAYSHSREGLEGGLLGYFNLASDPLNQASDRLGLLLYRNAPTVTAAPLVIRHDAERLATATAWLPGVAPTWTDLAWLLPVAGQLGGPEAGTLPAAGSGELLVRADRNAALAWLTAQGRLDPAIAAAARAGRWLVPSLGLAIDRAHGLLAVVRPDIAVGWGEAGGAIDAGPLRAAGLTWDALLAVNACDGQPVAASRRLLITHLTDLADTGTRYAGGDRRTLQAWGALPHLLHAGAAEVRLRVAAGAWQGFTLSPGGRRLAALALRRDVDDLVFQVDVAGGDGARMLYELVRE